MTKVVLYQAYFGKLPEYFGLWLESARNNKNYDFYFVSDCDFSEYDLPENVIVHEITFNELRQQFADTLNDQTIVLDKPYKLCDYKPLYGLLFEEVTKNYDFWGYFDIDLYFGNLDEFIPQEVFDNYNKIGMYGHLTLIRNNKRMNNLWQSDFSLFIPKEFLHNSRIYGVDEVVGVNLIAKTLGISQYRLPITDVATVYPWFKDTARPEKYQLLYVQHGEPYRAVASELNSKVTIEKVAYIHWQKKKPIIKASDNFYFTEKGTIAFNGRSVTDVLFEQGHARLVIQYHKAIYFAKKIRERLFSGHEERALFLKKRSAIRDDIREKRENK